MGRREARRSSSPLWGGVRGGGGSGKSSTGDAGAPRDGVREAAPFGSIRRHPHPLPLPARGRGIVAAAFVCLAVSPTAARDLDVAIGKATFDRLWAPAPASTRSADGLGPLYAARSCAACHPAGGRAGFRLGRDDPATAPGLAVRLFDAHGRADPRYGAQLQPDGASGAAGEGRPASSRATDGSGRPEWRVADLGYGPLDPATRVSTRVAPALDGIGLLARVPDAAILAREDPDDRDGDGVSGRANRVGGAVGRFGWKAAEPTLAAQTAAAFALDLGLSTEARPDPAGDCTGAQAACRAVPHGGDASEPEVRPELLRALLVFLERRPPPAPRGGGPKGERLFAATGCAACHAPSLPLEGGGSAAAYTDLLLHDMGPGLDDGAGEAGAEPGEWRTAPLWGLSGALKKGSGLMHDGRAKSIAESVGWHDGEAAGARRRFEALSARDQRALVEFVAGL